MNIRTLKRKLKEENIERTKVCRTGRSKFVEITIGDVVIMVDKEFDYFYSCTLKYKNSFLANFYVNLSVQDEYYGIINVIKKIPIIKPHLDKVLKIKRRLERILNNRCDVYIYFDNLEITFQLEKPIEHKLYNIMYTIDNNELVLNDVVVEISRKYTIPNDMDWIREDFNIVNEEKTMVKNILKEVDFNE